MKRFPGLFLMLFIHAGLIFAQGSWNPPGAGTGFPRTLLDSAAIPVVRATLAGPEILPLYGSIWAYARSAVPPGNITNEDRATRAMIAREAAFVLLMDRGVSSGTIIPLSPGARDSLQISAIALLEAMNTEVEVGTFWTFYTPWQHRSKELISYLVAYDLLKGAGVPAEMLETSKSNLLTFTANLYQKAMATYTFLNLKFFTYQFNNHSIMTASALGLAAVVFNDHASTNVNYQPQNWINAGLYNLDNTLWIENGTYPRVSEPDTLAGYAEGPNYFKYGFENAFPFLRAMGIFLPDGYFAATFNNSTRNILNPWHDDRYDRLYDWLNKIRMPDGGFPSIHDSYMGYGTVIMALSGKPEFNLPNPAFTPDDPTFRTQYIATNVPHGVVTDSLFQALPAAGSLVFRSSWGPSAVYMHFIGKHGVALTGAKSHHQGDASGFSLMAYGELLAVDPGYPGASLAELTNKASDHSLILVNGAGPLPPSGEFVSTSTNTAFIENCFDTPGLDFGEVRVSYQGAEIVRKSLFVRNSYFLLSDFIHAASPKNYTFQLHGNGLHGSSPVSVNGSFAPDYSNDKGVYTRDTVSLLAHITAVGGTTSFVHETDSMVIDGGFRSYSKMLVQKNNVTDALFLSTLLPFTSGGAPQVLAASQGGSLVSARIQQNQYNDLVFCSQSNLLSVISADSSGIGKAVKGNGNINFLSESTGGGFVSVFIRHGDSIIAGGQTLILAGKKMDVAWMKVDSVISGGFVSDSGTIGLFSTGPLQLLRGQASSISYDTLRNLTIAALTAKGNFLFGPADLTRVWNGQHSSDWHHPGNWHVLGHPNFSGVPAASNHVIIPSGVMHFPEVSSAGPATCHDLTIEAGAALIVGSLNWLTVEGTLVIEVE